jgi:hypothetical protein
MSDLDSILEQCRPEGHHKRMLMPPRLCPSKGRRKPDASADHLSLRNRDPATGVLFTKARVVLPDPCPVIKWE